MSTAGSAVPVAPWRSTFLDHLSKLDSPEFVFGTCHPLETPKLTEAPTPVAPVEPPIPFVPRLRYCIFRGMWAMLPENKHNTAEQNPRVFESDLPTFTTDVRMQKTSDIFATSAGHASDASQIQGSGGGGPCEAVFWIKDTGTQWRFRGSAFLVGNDVDSDNTSGVRTMKTEVGARMRNVGEGGRKDGWDWSRELRAHFGNCSPAMRGSWRNPPPGTPTHGQEPDPDHKLGQKVEDLDDEIARSNFRVVIIKPDEVEQCDISDPNTARRTLYRYVDKDGQGSWESEELWP